MRRYIFITLALITIAVMGVGISIEAQNDAMAAKKAQHTAQQEARQQRRAQRLAEYERHIDSLILSHNFRFIPETMQQLPAGMMRNLTNPAYEVVVMNDAVDVCMPFLKGYTPPYYPVVFNYVLPSVSGYTAEQTQNGWEVTFSTSMFSASEYKFSFDISSHYGSTILTISSPMYNSVQYMGNIIGI